MVRCGWRKTDKTDETDGTAGSTSLVQLNLVRPVTRSERPRNNHVSHQHCWGVRERQETLRAWCHCRAMEMRVLTEVVSELMLGFGNCNLMALDGCTSGENMLFVFTRRGNARMQTRSQKSQWNHYLSRRDECPCRFCRSWHHG